MRAYCETCDAVIEGDELGGIAPCELEGCPFTLDDRPERAPELTEPGASPTFAEVDATLRVPAHADDPHTAQATARLALDRSPDRREVLSACAAYPMTAEQLGLVLPHQPAHGPAKRASDLVALELLERTTETRPTISGNAAHVYRPTGLGRQLAEPWTGAYPPGTIERALAQLTVGEVSGGTFYSWACPWCEQRRYTNRAGLIQHLKRYCEHVTVEPKAATD